MDYSENDGKANKYNKTIEILYEDARINCIFLKGKLFGTVKKQRCK